ncbi:hypothetical protein [Sphingobacterium bovistauri]|uniref:Uncharacterized protein n=1 Tax=Sphingobacterium bovistauri TaxID=2781959 RepID=A0ABS7Z807_9SPHI|nr:hypothetical protein [Sphingobacterium bovistauri]MCA5005717.1 hypothetical protein [Sphingobacterium bovistauri]
MKSIFKYMILAVFTLGVVGCDKNDPITELGSTNGEFSAQLSVSYNNTRPAIGDSLIVTASTWQRDDKFDKIVFYETIYESFGVEIKLKHGTSINTKDIEQDNNKYSTLIMSDTIKSRGEWGKVLAQDLDKYWVTVTNNYVIRLPYTIQRLDGKYPSDNSLITKMTTSEFAILKSLLAYNITKEDYLALFPGSPSSHFTTAGSLTNVGMDNLRSQLTSQKLLEITNAVVKKGAYTVALVVDVITPTGAVTSSTPRIFENTI